MYHSVEIIGNLGRDPEMRYTPGGQAVTSMNVACNRQWTSSSGERVKETIWFRVTVWGKQAEVCSQWLRKGRTVHVRGRLNPDPQTGGPKVFERNDGTAGAAFEITAETVTFLGGRNDDGGGFQGEGEGAYADAPMGAGGDEWDDL